jgi:hypothetical protein
MNPKQLGVSALFSAAVILGSLTGCRSNPTAPSSDSSVPQIDRTQQREMVDMRVGPRDVNPGRVGDPTAPADIGPTSLSDAGGREGLDPKRVHP